MVFLNVMLVSMEWTTAVYDYYNLFEIDESFIAVIEEIAGEDGVAVASLLTGSYEVTDEKIAEKTGMKLNDVRKILYILFDNQLVSYRRIRDKSTGWFIYLWRLNRDNVEFLVNTKKELVLEKLKERLEYEKTHVFFYCPTDGVRMTFEDATELNFKCPVCNRPLESYDNSKIISFLEKKIKELEKELSKRS